MNSRLIACTSAALLALAGTALLFAADDILPAAIPRFDPRGAWLGQLLGSAWLGLAALNWLTRRTVLGGIYGRPVVIANLFVYFISATVLVRRAATSQSMLVMVATGVAAALALLYGVLLFRGPFSSSSRSG